MIDIDVRGLEEFKAFIKAFGNTGKKIIDDELYIIAKDVRNDIIKSMRESPGGGRWYKRKGVMHQASIPGFPPKIDSGNYIKSFIIERYVGFTKLTTMQKNPPYPSWLEEGTKKMLARPSWKPAVERSDWQKRIKNRIIAERFAGRRIGE